MTVIAALFVATSQQTNLNRAGFIDCEATGSCAPKKVSNAPEGFVSGVSMDSLYSFAEEDDARQEVANAKKEIAKHQVEEAKKKAEEKKRLEKEKLEREIKELKEKTRKNEAQKLKD